MPRRGQQLDEPAHTHTRTVRTRGGLRRHPFGGHMHAHTNTRVHLELERDSNNLLFGWRILLQ